MNTLGERLSKAMAIRPGRTQAGLARACGIKPPSVSNWFTGKSKAIEGANLIKASEYLGVRSKWLATGLGPMTVYEVTGAADSAFTLKAQEEQKVLEIKNWPFQEVTLEKWQKLTTAQKLAVEAVITSFAGATLDQTKKIRSN